MASELASGSEEGWKEVGAYGVTHTTAMDGLEEAMRAAGGGDDKTTYHCTLCGPWVYTIKLFMVVINTRVSLRWRVP
jgi:hypothetical protein